MAVFSHVHHVLLPLNGLVTGKHILSALPWCNTLLLLKMSLPRALISSLRLLHRAQLFVADMIFLWLACLWSCVCVCVFSRSVMPDSAISWTVAGWAPLSVRFPRQEYGVGCRFLLQGIFPTQGSNLGLLHCRQILYHCAHQGNPIINT